MTAHGESDLQRLLAAMAPQLMDGEYVFCSFERAQYGDHAHLRPIASIHEAEGLTLVVERAVADDAHIPYEAVFKGITLTIHSSLEAVGLTAAFASQLATAGISANVLAGFYHDHIFVGLADATAAMTALEALARSH